MNRYFRRKAVGAGVFVLIIMCGFIFNMKKLSLSIDWKAGAENIIASVEAAVNEQVYGKYQFIDAFGATQKLLGKREMNDFEVIQDEQGFLHYTYFGEGPKDTKKLAESLKEYQEGIENKDTRFLYVMTPDKYIPGFTTYAKGLPYDYANETADQFLKQLGQQNIDYFDLREKLKDSGIAYEDMFYKTDHHWKAETAFWGFASLLDELQKKYDFPVSNYSEVTSLDNYNAIQYKNSFIGSMGRKTGVNYSGVDDFTMLYPKFQTNYSYKAVTKNAKIETSGTFDQALLSMVPFQKDGSRYDVMKDKYASYLYGNQGIAHIHNKKVKGPKVLIAKDSFMLPTAAFLSTVCQDVYLVDVRYYDKSILKYTNSIEDLDYVIVSYTPQDLSEEFFSLQ